MACTYSMNPLSTSKDNALYNLTLIHIHSHASQCRHAHHAHALNLGFSVLLKEEPKPDRYLVQDNGNELHNILHPQVWA